MTDLQSSYAATLERLLSLGRFGVRMGLERMEQALEQLGRPHHHLAAVHLAGTNGKGSTAAMLERCLRHAGLRTGLYTSPHLSRFTERIRVEGREISREAVVQLASRVLPHQQLTFFEVVTAMALVHLAQQRVDLAVVETGMGGRLDATNVVRPQVTILTHLGMDHTEVLGPDLESIAREKAGIIKPGIPLVCAPPPTPEIERFLGRRCRQQGAELLLAGRDFELTQTADGARFQMQGWQLDGLRWNLQGEHQAENAALCLAAIHCLRRRGYAVRARDARAGLEQVRWPGRMEWIGDHLLDGALVPGGARALARAVAGLKQAPFCLIMGLMGHHQRDLPAMLQPLLPLAQRVIFTRPVGRQQFADPSELAAQVPGALSAPDLASALALARQTGRPGLITGSLYLVGEARALLAGEAVDPVLTADPR